MLKLIKLEWKKNNIGKYIRSAVIVDLGYWFELVINGNVINRRKPVTVKPAAGETEVSEE